MGIFEGPSWGLGGKVIHEAMERQFAFGEHDGNKIGCGLITWRSSRGCRLLPRTFLPDHHPILYKMEIIATSPQQYKEVEA